jgi:hypothetical protein
MGKPSPDNISEPEDYILPSKDDEMISFIKKFKIDMMEHVVTSVQIAIDNDISEIEVFRFKDGPYAITIPSSEFKVNMEHISKFYRSNQLYELCPRVEQ